MLKRLLSFFLIFILSSPSWASYSYSRAIIIDHTKVSTSDQTQFPILVCANGSAPCQATVSGLNQTGAGAKVQNSNGYDIIFTTDSACTNKLTWDMESYVASTGEFQAWVTNTSTPLSSSVDTTFYICYGDATVSSFQSTASAVWDSSYKSVYHSADNAASTTLVDAKGLTNGTLTANSSTLTATGKIGKAIDYGGTNEASIGNSANESGAAAFTEECWYKPTTVPGAQLLIGKSYNPGGQSVASMGLYGTSSGKGNTGMFFWRDNTIFSEAYDNTLVVTAGTWYHFAAVFNGSLSGNNRIIGYMNGASRFSTTNYGGAFPTTLYSSGNAIKVGTGNPGILDEIRISTTARSADWITTEYNSMNNPNNGSGQFYSMGAEISAAKSAIIKNAIIWNAIIR